MIAVRVTLENGVKKYIKEENPYRHKMFILADKLSDATFYDSKYEFYTAWNLLVKYPRTWKISTQDYKETYIITNFTAIDDEEDSFIDINPNEIVKGSTEIFVNKREFRLLMNCFYSCSRWLYTKDDDWIAFPKDDDYERIDRIEYSRSGLISGIWNVFPYRHDKISVPSCYSFFENRIFMATNQDIQKIFLDDRHDEFKRIIVRLNANQ